MWQEFSPCQTALCREAREARRWRARKNLQAPFFMFFSTNGHRASAPGPVGTGAPALRTTGLAVAETKAALRAPKTADRAPWVHPPPPSGPRADLPLGTHASPAPRGQVSPASGGSLIPAPAEAASGWAEGRSGEGRGRGQQSPLVGCDPGAACGRAALESTSPAA